MSEKQKKSIKKGGNKISVRTVSYVSELSIYPYN
jgi:hypothetical protein